MSSVSIYTTAGGEKFYTFSCACVFFHTTKHVFAKGFDAKNPQNFPPPAGIFELLPPLVPDRPPTRGG